MYVVTLGVPSELISRHQIQSGPAVLSPSTSSGRRVGWNQLRPSLRREDPRDVLESRC